MHTLLLVQVFVVLLYSGYGVKMKEIRLLTAAKDMYQTYKIMTALNETMKEYDYRDFVDFWVDRGYKQFVYFQDEKPVAAIAVMYTPLMGIVPNKAYKIANVAALPETRGTGIARELMAFTLDAMGKEGNVVNASLECSKKNDRANSFYEKCGFSKDEAFHWRIKIASERKEAKQLSL